MTSELVVREEPAESVAVVRLADAATSNALSPALVEQLVARLDEVDGDHGVNVLVLAGLDSGFCSGASRELLEGLLSGQMQPTELGLAIKLLEMSVPVIAACRGAAVGGGFALALAADHVLLADERRYGFNFMDLGITPGMGTTSLASHFLGAAVAGELLTTGELRRGRDFGGSAVHVYPAADIENRALDLALRMADKPRRNLSMLKRTLTLERRRAFVQAMTLESLMHETSLSSLDLNAFMEKQR